MICDICGKDEIKIKRITRSYGTGAELFVIENVPLMVCQSCGESYFTAETMHEIERIKLHRNNFAQKRTVAVAEYV